MLAHLFRQEKCDAKLVKNGVLLPKGDAKGDVTIPLF
jgi:hypothetical protein